MNALGHISQASVASAMLPVGLPTAGSAGAAKTAAPRTVEPTVRLDIRRDDSIDRVVFEYRKISDGQLVQRFPARQVVEFYQRMEAIADAAERAETVAKASGDGPLGPASDRAVAAESAAGPAQAALQATAKADDGPVQTTAAAPVALPINA